MASIVYKIYLLTIREFKRNFRNMAYIITVIMPFIITMVFFGILSAKSASKITSFSLFANLNILTLSIISFSLAILTETENDVGTHLIHSGIKVYQLVISKCIATTICIVLYQVFLGLIYQLSMITIVKVIVISIIVAIVVQVLIALIGYRCSNESFIGNSITIIYTLFLLVPEFQDFYGIIKYTVKILPTYYSKSFIDSAIGLPVEMNFIHLFLILLIWLMIPIMIMKKHYTKVGNEA